MRPMQTFFWLVEQLDVSREQKSKTKNIRRKKSVK